MADQMDLFERQQVSEGVIALSSANGTLRKLMQYEPQFFPIGETVRFVFEMECVGVHFDRVDNDTPDGPLRRVQNMKITEVHRL